MLSKKLYVICHMLSSLDGKITFGKVQGEDSDIDLFADEMDLYDSTQEKLGANALLCGRVTMEMFAESINTPLGDVNIESINSDDYVVRDDQNGYFVCVDTQGQLRWKDDHIILDSKEISIHKFNLIILVTSNTPKEYLAYLKQKGISYILAGEEKLNFKEAFTKLTKLFGIERLIVEGGGNTNGSILDEDLIDEISILLVPVVVNNYNSPELFYKKLTEARLHKFKLNSFEKLDRDVLWLRYTK